jgi:hypothetical protein
MTLNQLHFMNLFLMSQNETLSKLETLVNCCRLNLIQVFEVLLISQLCVSSSTDLYFDSLNETIRPFTLLFNDLQAAALTLFLFFTETYWHWEFQAKDDSRKWLH